jgi:hypothetical protein
MALVLANQSCLWNEISPCPSSATLGRRWRHHFGLPRGGIPSQIRRRGTGDLKAALKSYSDSLAIRERLAQSDPGNAGWQPDLSVSYAKIGGVYRKLNETAKAREALAAGRAIIGPLLRQHPDQRQWKQDLAWFDARIVELGRLCRKRNRQGDEGGFRNPV